MKPKRNHIIIGIGIIVLIAGAYMLMSEPEEPLSVKVDGVELKPPTAFLTVFGELMDVEYDLDVWTFIMTPRQQAEVNVGIWNPYTNVDTNTYYATVYTPDGTLWTSTEVVLAPNEVHEFYFTYTAPEFGREVVYIDSYYKGPTDTDFIIDDMKIFNVTVEAPLVCEDLWWYDDNNRVCGFKEFCSMYYYQGLETFDTQAACEASLNGDPTPTPTPTETPTATPTDTPRPDPDPDPWLIYGIGGLGVLGVLYFILKAKK